eukprot:g3898.t1
MIAMASGIVAILATIVPLSFQHFFFRLQSLVFLYFLVKLLLFLSRTSFDTVLSLLKRTVFKYTRAFIPEGSLLESERHGGELVARVLQSHGVKFLFTLVGGHISPLLAESKSRGIRVIDVRHEVNAVFAADAVARLTGVVGVAAVTAGPGVTNTVTAVKNAQMAQSPLVLLGGAAATLLKGRGALQDIDQLILFQGVCKATYTVSRVRDIVPTLKEAFQVAKSGVPGPVFVELPIDTLYPVGELRANMGLSQRIRAREADAPDVKPDVLSRVILPVEAVARSEDVKTYVKRKNKTHPLTPIFLHRAVDSKKQPFVVEAYLQYSLRRLYCGAFDWDKHASAGKTCDDVKHSYFTPLPVSVPMPKDSAVSATKEALVHAKKPVFVIGSQALLWGKEGKYGATALAEALRLIGVPCFLGGMSRGLLGKDATLHCKQGRGNALKQADVVVLLGAVPDFRMNYGRSLRRRSHIITINRSAADLKLNSDLFWKPALASQSDPAMFVIRLAQALTNDERWGMPLPNTWDVACSDYDASAKKPLHVTEGAKRRATWCAELKQFQRAREARNRAKAKEVSIGRGEVQGKELINPLDLCYQLDSLLPDDTILVADGGDFVGCAANTMSPSGPLRWLDPGAFGTLGVGGGFALAAKLCNPSAEVWIIWGDGSSGYSLAEFDTFQRFNVPVGGLIGNDACWTQIEREQIPSLGSDVACPLAYCAYETVAIGYGGAGVACKKGKDVKKALLLAQHSLRKGDPFVVNAWIGKTNFREGSISV